MIFQHSRMSLCLLEVAVQVETKFDHYLLCLFNLLGKENNFFVSEMFHLQKLRGKLVLITIN
jgi:hypothetical protein